MREREIAEELNQSGVPSGTGRPWTRGLVHQILINPKYIGANVYNRKSFKLKHRRINNPESMWVRKDDVFPALVSPEQFREARRIIDERNRRFTDSEMLEKLRLLFLQEGRLSGILIDEKDEMPSSAAYQNRFGSLVRAYTLIGYTPERDYAFVEINRQLRAAHREQVDAISTQLVASGAHVEADAESRYLTINREFTASLVLARCRTLVSGSFRWIIRLEHECDCDLTIAARMDMENKRILDYYVLPRADRLSDTLRLALENPLVLDVYRFETLDFFYRACRRTQIGDAA